MQALALVFALDLAVTTATTELAIVDQKALIWTGLGAATHIDLGPNRLANRRGSFGSRQRRRPLVEPTDNVAGPEDRLGHKPAAA